MSRSNIEQQLRAIISGAVNSVGLAGQVVLGNRALYDNEAYEKLMTIRSEQNADGEAYGALWIVQRIGTRIFRGPSRDPDIPMGTLLRRYTYLVEGYFLYPWSEEESDYQKFHDMVDSIMDELAPRVTARGSAFRTNDLECEMDVEALESGDVAYTARLTFTADEYGVYSPS